MTIECYHAVCPFHGCNRGENEGPYCDEAECRLETFSSGDWRRIELFRGYELARWDNKIPSVDCVVEYQLDDPNNPIMYSDVLLASAYYDGIDVFACSIIYNPEIALLEIILYPGYWRHVSATNDGITVPANIAFMVAPENFDMRRYTVNVSTSLGLKIVSESPGYEF